MIETIANVLLLSATIFLVYTVHQFHNQMLKNIEELNKWVDQLAKNNLSMHDVMMGLTYRNPYMKQKMDTLVEIVKEKN